MQYLIILLMLFFGVCNAEVVSDNILEYISNIEQRIVYLEEENSKLINNIEEIDNKIEKLTSIVQSTNNAISLKQVDINNINIQQKEYPNKNQQSDYTINEISESDHYNECMKQISNGNFADAALNLAKFIEQYPDSTFAQDAYYWMGEIYFSEEKYREAAILYLNGYRKNPKGRRSIDNVFKLAMSIKNTSNPIGACHTFKSILTEFGPISDNIKEKVNKELLELKELQICE